MIQISTETFGNVLVAHTPDELSEETAVVFLDALAPPIEAGQIKIVLQMDRSESFDSAGLTAPLDLQDELRSQGGRVVVSGLRDPGRTIFKLTRLDQHFDLYDSVIDAVASCEK